MFSNRAAWLMAKSARPMEVKSAPYTSPNEDEIVVKNGAVAVNQIDGFKQIVGDNLFTWIKYPFIMGGDLAGEVVAVGKGVTRFEIGDRVLGHGVGMEEVINKPSESAFQQYTVVRSNMASPIPSTMPYETACVLPLCLSTAAVGLFGNDYLALPYPTLSPKRTGKTVLIWGGSSSVGSNAIQLAVAAGCDVITTASPRNFDYARKLGAVEVFDYRSTTVIQNIIKAFSGRQCAGAFAIGNGSLRACIEILAACKGKKFVCQVSVELPGGMPSTTLKFIMSGIPLGWFTLSMWYKSKVKCVETKWVSGGTLVASEVSRAIYEDFLPAALAHGKYIAAPEPLVVGRGLEYIQEAIDLSMKGVSAKKVVVAL